MRATFITTLNHNVGDDFVREGILYLLERVLGKLDIQLIHKHIPVTARPEWDWFYHGGWSKKLDRLPRPAGRRASKIIDALPLNPRTDKVLNCDLLIQSGAPVYWYGPDAGSCADVEWFEPLIEKRWRSVPDRAVLLNLAGGTCQPYHSDGKEFASSPRTLDHIRKFFDDCQLTTLRDSLSLEVLKQVNRSAPVLPCTSIFARKRLGFEPEDSGFIALNYMPAAGHYKFGQDIDPGSWERVFVSFAKWVARTERCVLVCHNKKELHAARTLLPELEYFYSEDHPTILKFYSRARYGIMNRVHGAFAIASYGRPAIVIGTDSRARMTETIGLRNFFVSDVTTELLEAEKERLAQSIGDYASWFLETSEKAESTYISLLKAVFKETDISVAVQ